MTNHPNRHAGALRHRDRWQPMRRASLKQTSDDVLDEDIDRAMKRMGLPDTDRHVASEAIWNALNQCEYWINDIYQVSVNPVDVELNGEDAGMAHLCIRRRDGKPIFRDWRHFQLIKNELVGEECEGLELYPAESRLNDTCNKFHIYVFTDPTYRVPFGKTEVRMIHKDTPADLKERGK